jgi:hypothetical protein
MGQLAASELACDDGSVLALPSYDSALEALLAPEQAAGRRLAVAL